MNTVLLITAIASGIIALGLGLSLWSEAAHHRDRDIPDHERIGWMARDMIAGLLTDGLSRVVVELGKLPATVRTASDLWRADPSYRTTCYWFLSASAAAVLALSLS